MLVAKQKVLPLLITAYSNWLKSLVMRKLIIVWILILGFNSGKAQFASCSCSATVTGGTSVNFSSLTWTGTGCPTAGSSSYSGSDLCVSMGSGSTLTMDKNFTITGDFNITNSGSGVTFVLPANTSLNISGSLGDATNNNMDFTINGTLVVGGAFYGKNSNAFAGTGSVTSGGMYFGVPPNGGTAPTGGTGITWSVPPGTCTPTGSSFCTTTVLPILLAKFQGTSLVDKVKLEWSTSSEINFNYFSLEKSLNARDFHEIAQVKGQGTTNERHNYSYDDQNPILGRSYYRLTSVDFDNYQQTFEVISVEYHGEKKFSISPNPSDGSTVNLNFNFDKATDGFVAVYDNLGVLLGTYPVEETRSISFATPLKSGVYLAKYSSPSFTKTERFVVK